MDRTKDLMHLAYVPRWGVVPIQRPQSVAEHSFRVAAITVEICSLWNKAYDGNVNVADALWYAIIHDAEESFTGDIVSPFKRYLRGLDLPTLEWLKEELVGTRERAVVKIADSIEALDYIIQWGVPPSGQLVAQDIYTNLEKSVHEFMVNYKFPEIHHIVNDLVRRAGVNEAPRWMLDLAPKIAPTEDSK